MEKEINKEWAAKNAANIISILENELEKVKEESKELLEKKAYVESFGDSTIIETVYQCDGSQVRFTLTSVLSSMIASAKYTSLKDSDFINNVTVMRDDLIEKRKEVRQIEQEVEENREIFDYIIELKYVLNQIGYYEKEDDSYYKERHLVRVVDSLQCLLDQMSETTTEKLQTLK